jgi:hypothetical protein
MERAAPWQARSALIRRNAAPPAALGRIEGVSDPAQQR